MNINICFREKVDSTNLWAKQMARAGAPEGTLAFAETQTAGRGRRGRSWASPPGTAIYMSLVLRPAVQPEAASGLTLVMGLSAAQGVQRVLDGLARTAAAEARPVCGRGQKAEACERGRLAEARLACGRGQKAEACEYRHLEEARPTCGRGQSGEESGRGRLAAAIGACGRGQNEEAIGVCGSEQAPGAGAGGRRGGVQPDGESNGLTAVDGASGERLRAEIKWPNDVVLRGKKICGILTEMSAGPDGIAYVVVGIGINVNNRTFPPELSDRATSLALEADMPGDRSISRSQVRDAVLDAFDKNYKIFLEHGDLSGLMDAYNGVLANRDREVRVLDEREPFGGIARGINAQGELLVEREPGKTEAVRAGEVSVRGICGYV